MNEDPHRIVADAAGAVIRIKRQQHSCPPLSFQPFEQTQIALRGVEQRALCVKVGRDQAHERS
jgi:hypothetical protein